jgi:hypothetical protein
MPMGPVIILKSMPSNPVEQIEQCKMQDQGQSVGLMAVWYEVHKINQINISKD